MYGNFDNFKCFIVQMKSDQAGHPQGQPVNWIAQGQGQNMNEIVMLMASTEIHTEEVPLFMTHEDVCLCNDASGQLYSC